MKLLGHVVDKDGIHTDPEKCQAISKMPRPTSVTEVKRFTGACNYYRELIPGYAALAAPLLELTLKGRAFIWAERQEQAFVHLKNELLSDHCVGYPDENKPYSLYTDACDYALGAILMQLDDKTGMEKAIGEA